MKTEPAHTPTPWNVVSLTSGNYALHGDGKEIAFLNDYSNDKANAAFIVRAVNCHQELINGSSLLPKEKISYGGSMTNQEREDMEKLMEMEKKYPEEWYALNRREPSEPILPRLIGWCAIVFGATTVVAQIAIHFHWLKP